jgi:hypothetical protein
LGNQRRLAASTAKNIEIPPIRGMCPECCFLSQGLSTKPISTATGLKNVIAINANKNAVIIVASIYI